MNLADKWKFEKYLPDEDDAEAKYLACKRYIDLVSDSDYESAESEVDWFHAGFVRGMAWMMFKLQNNTEKLNAR